MPEPIALETFKAGTAERFVLADQIISNAMVRRLSGEITHDECQRIITEALKTFRQDQIKAVEEFIESYRTKMNISSPVN